MRASAARSSIGAARPPRFARLNSDDSHPSCRGSTRAASTGRRDCIVLDGAMGDSLCIACASICGLSIVCVSAIAVSPVRSRGEDSGGDTTPSEGSSLIGALAAVGPLAAIGAPADASVLADVAALEGLDAAGAACGATVAIIALDFDATTGTVACVRPAFRA